MNCRVFALTAILLGLAACGTSITLAQRSAATPPGVDLSGQWLLRRDAVESVEQIARAGAKAAGDEPIIRSRRETGTRPARRSSGGLVHVFLETGAALKITQTADGLFISFDRAVVEEYRFGEMREVNVGPVTAMRSSGWDGSSYVIQTLDDDGEILTERYRLQEDGRVLVRDVFIEKGDSRKLEVQLFFDRQEAPGEGGGR